MSQLKKILGINLSILLIYSICIHFYFTGYDHQIGVLIMSAVMIILQAVLNLIFSVVNFSSGEKDQGKALLLSSGLVLVIGFSICGVSAEF